MVGLLIGLLVIGLMKERPKITNAVRSATSAAAGLLVRKVSAVFAAL